MAERWSEPEIHAVRTLARILLLEGRLQDAMAMFRGVVEIRPADPWSHLALGVIHRQAGRLEEAVTELDEALRLNPQFLEAAVTLGEVHLLRNDGQAARGCSAMVDYLSRSASFSPALEQRAARLAVAMTRIPAA